MQVRLMYIKSPIYTRFKLAYKSIYFSAITDLFNNFIHIEKYINKINYIFHKIIIFKYRFINYCYKYKVKYIKFKIINEVLII